MIDDVALDAPKVAESVGLGHVRALDGIRALAVVAVLLYHSEFAWLQGGFLGVSVFFTLSGYLITSLLLREHESTGRIDLVAFWSRRFRRLAPAALVQQLEELGVARISLAVNVALAAYSAARRARRTPARKPPARRA